MSLNALVSRGIAVAMLSVAVMGCEGQTEDLANKAMGDVEQSMSEATQSLEGAKEKMQETMDAAKAKMADMAKSGEDTLKNLGADITNLLGPFKEKLMGLESLKDTPAELKTSVTELLTSLESNIANLPLPEGLKTTIANLKEKLVALQQFLEGNADLSKLQDYLGPIKELVESQMNFGQ